MSALKYWIWLSTRPYFSVEETAWLLARFGTPEAAYLADPAEYDLAGLKGVRRAAMLDKSLDRAEQILGDCERLGLRIMTLQDADYPTRLRNIDLPPSVLYIKGRLFAFDEEVAIGVVGSRRPSPYGVEMAGRLGLELARRGALVVSGIAEGLDSAALRGALRGGGPVVSVLGGGADVIYPKQNSTLFEDVAAAGALISEYPPGTRTDGSHFPVRNRIISGLSLGVVAVEAAAHSGTLITARLALDQNRDVFAFPGPADAPMSRGTNLLIQRGEAKLIFGAQDVLVEYEQLYPTRLCSPEPMRQADVKARLGPVPDRPAQPQPQQASGEKEVDKDLERAYITLKDCTSTFTEDERAILTALLKRPLSADELVEATQIPARRILSALTMLQVQNYVAEQPGKRFAPGDGLYQTVCGPV